MKLQSKHMEGEHEHRVYDTAQTPWQRVLLSGVVPEHRAQEWQAAIEALDPLRLVQHIEALQRAVWRHAEGSSGKTLMRFSLDVCASPPGRSPQRSASNVLASVVPDPASVRDWSRSMNDPFLGEWEQIHAYVRAQPMASAGEILREWQRRFPERFGDAHLSLLQRRLREIRASLVAESPSGERKSITASRTVSQSAQAAASLEDIPMVALVAPASALPSLLPSPEEEIRPVRRPQGSASDASSNKKEVENQHAPPVQLLPVACAADALSPAMMTIDHAITLFFQGKHTRNWEPKTREWHETSLKQLQRYVVWRKLFLLSSLTGSEIRGWLTFLRTEALTTGVFRVQSTISTYARSAHAFCAWLVEQGYLEQSPEKLVDGRIDRHRRKRLDGRWLSECQ